MKLRLNGFAPGKFGVERSKSRGGKGSALGRKKNIYKDRPRREKAGPWKD